MKSLLPGQLRWAWLSVFIVVADQVTKAWVQATMNLYESIKILPFFNLTLLYNRGAAFSFLNDAGGWQRWFFFVVAVVISGVIIRWLMKLPRHDTLQGIALSLVLGGALGNAWDRLVLGYVVDFLDVHAAGWHWPAFNIADAAISIGVILLVLGLFKQEHKHEQKS